MSQLKRNIIANYTSQIYVTIVGIALLPLYIKYMGSEAYGLVGFFAMLQAWFAVLDLGLTPTIGRETARYQGGATSALTYRQLYRALTVIFVVVAIVGGGALFLSSTLIATKWLNLETLPVEDVVVAVQIMAISVALRWMTGLYRGVVTGSEKLVWLSCFNATIATIRFVGVFATMWCYGFTPLVFFIHQFIVAIIEIVVLAQKTHRLLPRKNSLNEVIGWSFKPVKPILKFSLTIAFTASVWVFVTQTDKLVLSGILSLKDYGYFTLAVLVANGIMIISGPISSAIMPRMARLNAENKHEELIKVYRKSTQLVTIIAGSAAIALVATAKPLLIAWTGDTQLAAQAAPILQLYAAGNLFLSVAAFVYYLQYAKGILRYHLIGNIGLVVILIPSIIFAATVYGGVGAGYVWLSMNVLFLFIWVAYVHSKLEPKLHLKWLWNDVLKIILPSAALVTLISLIEIELEGRVENILFVIFVSTLILSSSMLFSEQVRSKLKLQLKINV
ncbi:oligosaccharide flippase family protein [Litorilituus lipolyticus]|uniref:Polysaccharide biosynthesis protein n=1 Tax=Litorilituus lipolyticus TaxID=2491017 RepID=A0A502L5F5_9GAMM|nr:oligosaccharide flippase family protein [Litorilituus lipolyticus]TPH18956.1 polysaccharide biosynthesis protein [Litorilituus lipolyticus]